MLSQQIGKRTLLGSRVAVPISELYYAPATVQAVRNDENGNEFVTVKMDNNNKRECLSSNLVGNGFKQVSDIKLHKNQKVFTQYNGREVTGVVHEHSDGTVMMSLPDFDKDVIRRPQEDVRLTESRNRCSPRQQDQDIDYRKIASVNASPNHGKKRQVSASIEVPQRNRGRKSSAEPTMDELMAAMVLSSLSSSPVFHNPRSPSVKKDSSPHSFGSSGVGSWNQDIQMSPVRDDTPHLHHVAPMEKTFSSTPERNKSVIQLAHSAGHSPASTGDPIEVDTAVVLETNTPMEEESHNQDTPSTGPGTPAPFQGGSILIQTHSPFHNPDMAKQTKKLESVQEEMQDPQEDRPKQNVLYQQPSIFYIPSLLPPNIQHLNRPEYTVHMQQVSTPPPPLAPADDRPYRESSPFSGHVRTSDVLIHAQDPSNHNRVYLGSAPASYYTIPLTWSSSPLSSSPLTLGQVQHARHTPSPLASAVSSGSASSPLQGMKFSTTSHPVNLPTYKVIDQPMPAAQPINIPGAKSFSWHSAPAQPNYSPTPSIVQQRQQMHHAASPKMSSPKTLPPGRKIRGDGKKCRKIYGMENRDMWCTACRWKKACQRFPD